MNTHRRYARTLAAGSVLLAVASAAVVVWALVSFGLGDSGYLLPVVAFLYGAGLLAWFTARERVAGRRSAACCVLFRTSGTVHGSGCTRRAQPADDAHGTDRGRA
ncbi:hypothetical protein [[Kitasatospora] papulosa]|uniref:hypothetical protein n=1 Tax=[Kitasatospora] papulosa TaxID=1464011 RepID=UPI0036ACC0C3